MLYWWRRFAEVNYASFMMQDPFVLLIVFPPLLSCVLVPEMGEVMKAENHIASASAFVDGGIQDACDDACSICLDEFSDSEPSTITSCKHDFHLHCILEWCQRSSNCPMCWQPLSLKDSSSQELRSAVEQERNFKAIQSRNASILQHVNDADFEERIMQHLAAAAAIRRSRHVGRRESSWTRSSAHERQQLTNQIPVSSSVASQGFTNDNRSNSSESSSPDGAGPSDTLLSFSEMWRSRLSSVSMQYRESFSRRASGLKEMLFSRSPSMTDIGSEIRREFSAGIATVSLMMEQHLESRDDNGETHCETPSSNGSNSNTTTSSS